MYETNNIAESYYPLNINGFSAFFLFKSSKKDICCITFLKTIKLLRILNIGILYLQ